MKLKNEFAPIREWASERGIYESGDPKTQALKLVEEVGELARAVIKEDLPEMEDAMGDSVVVLVNLAVLIAQKYGTKKGLEDCINQAYEVIRNRKGVMANGSFVKSDDQLKMDL